MIFFGNNISPACEYCAKGEKAADGKTILCERKGVVSPYASCRKFQYDPLKRTPKVMPAIPEYTQADFSLEPIPATDNEGDAL